MLDKLKCERCDHTWFPRHPNKLPKTCPKCKSPAWNKPLNDYWRAIREQNKRNRDNDLDKNN